MNRLLLILNRKMKMVVL